MSHKQTSMISRSSMDKKDAVEEHSLLEHSIQLQQPNYSRWQRLHTLSLVLTVALVTFAGGYLSGQKDSTMWNYDSASIVPNDVRKFLKTTNAGKSYPHFTETPFVRDEDPDIEAHPWRREPGPEIDAYFEENFGHPMIFLLTAEEMRRMGKDPLRAAHIPYDWGYGDRVFMARFDYTHQMHCLHVLQSALYLKHYHWTANRTSDLIRPVERMHAEHCIWALHDYISCHGSWDVYNYKWVEGMPRPVPDHSSMRQCRDMSPMKDFYKEHNVETDARVGYLIPQQGDYIHPTTPDRLEEYYQSMNATKGGLTSEEWLRQRTKDFNEAMHTWRTTGEIPRVYN